MSAAINQNVNKAFANLQINVLIQTVANNNIRKPFRILRKGFFQFRTYDIHFKNQCAENAASIFDKSSSRNQEPRSKSQRRSVNSNNYSLLTICLSLDSSH